MARIGQVNPFNYNSSSKINDEFENIIRYLVAAERGSQTLSEMMDVLFDEDGVFSPNIEMRLDSDAGLQYRIGDYDGAEEGWTSIAALADLRGPAGQNVGLIEGPFIYNRQDSTPDNAATIVDYVFDEANDDLLVYVNGVLLAEDAYTVDADAGTVTFDDAFDGSTLCTIYSIRAQSVSNYRRSDLVAVGTQAVFPFVHTADETLLVFRNGILQRPGGSYDYTASPSTDTITFTSSLSDGELVTVMTVENTALSNVGGLMLEDEYAVNGLIPWAKLSVEDDDIPQAKTVGLVTALSRVPPISISATTPSASTYRFWLKTSVTPNELYFSDGTQWLAVTPNSALPDFDDTDANSYLRVNGSGTGLEFGDIDFSALVPKTYMGAANGVASLDSSGLLPTAQLPEIFAAWTIPFEASGSVADGTYLIQRIFRQKIRIDGLTRKLVSGTCNIQLSVDGVAVGSVLGASSTGQDTDVSPVIEIDALSASRRLELVVTSGSTPVGLEVGLSASVLTV